MSLNLSLASMLCCVVWSIQHLQCKSTYMHIELNTYYSNVRCMALMVVLHNWTLKLSAGLSAESILLIATLITFNLFTFMCTHTQNDPGKKRSSWYIIGWLIYGPAWPLLATKSGPSELKWSVVTNSYQKWYSCITNSDSKSEIISIQSLISFKFLTHLCILLVSLMNCH